MMKWAMLAAMALSVAGALMSGAAAAKGAVWYVVGTKSGFDIGGAPPAQSDCRPAGKGFLASKTPQDDVRSLGKGGSKVEISKYPNGVVVDVISDPDGFFRASKRYYSNYTICERLRGPTLRAARAAAQAQKSSRDAAYKAELDRIPKN